MDNSSDEYHISFFKPTTDQAKANRNMVVWLVLIWFITIFGFQFMLWVIEKPTPEPAYLTYKNVWEKVENGSPDTKDLQELGQVTLSVLGKVAISPDERAALDNCLSWTLYELMDESSKAGFVSNVQKLEKIKEGLTDISDNEYIDAKSKLSADLGPKLALSPRDVRVKILPIELVSASASGRTVETKSYLPGIMEKYLIHNQSFLTDFKFLGFPFHYFYTAIFLLILFVGLCWLYCVKTDSLNAKLNIVD